MADIIKKIKDEVTFENVLSAALKTPGVKINRSTFLKKELMKYYSEEVVSIAIKSNPAKAGISKNSINKISRSVIEYETKKATAISVAASLPSSIAPVAAVGAATADITSYFAHILRVVQKLAYLYGFEDFKLNEDEIDSETMDFIMIFMGVMFGVQGAASTLSKLANTFTEHLAKSLARQALTKGTIYPIVKNIATKIGIHMTKQIFADTVASAVPVAGSLLSGGLTYAMFKPCCNKLRKNLMHYKLSDPEFYKKIVDVVDFDDVDESPND